MVGCCPGWPPALTAARFVGKWLEIEAVSEGMMHPLARRPKGPPVWLDMDQQALDDAYNQEKYAPNRTRIIERRIADSARARAILGAPERVAYGRSEIERLGIFRTAPPNAPVNIFLPR